MGRKSVVGISHLLSISVQQNLKEEVEKGVMVEEAKDS